MAVPSNAQMILTSAQAQSLQSSVPAIQQAAVSTNADKIAAQTARTGAETARNQAQLAASEIRAYGQIHWDETAGRYTNDSLRGFFAARSTPEVYGVAMDKGLAVECEKTQANAGISDPVPSTDSGTGTDPYRQLSPFFYIEVNGGVEEDGTPFVTAIEGDEHFSRDGSNGNVWIMAPVLFWQLSETSNTVEISVSDTPLKGFDAQPKAYLPSGELRPYMLYAKYQMGEGSAGEPLSVSGVEPKASVSHNTLRTFTKAASTGYSGKSYADDWYMKVMFLLKYGTKDSQSVYAQVSSVTAAVMTGLCDHLVGDGSPNPLDGKNPFVMQGIEMALGLRDILGDAILYAQEICVVLDSQKSSTSVTASYTRTGKYPPAGDDTGYEYPTHVDSAAGLLFGVGKGASTSTGMSDGTYMAADGTTGTREWLSLGTWSFGSYSGLWYLNGASSLSGASADNGSRLSAIGRGGEAA